MNTTSPQDGVTTDEVSPLAAVERALDGMDKEKIREYYSAIELAPELVRKETPYQDFLTTEAGDAEKAAVRLANYWKARKDFFGERWLLPLHQTGKGALTMEDIAMFRTGFLVTIPRPDNKGLVALYNEGRLPRSPSDTLMRCTFYVCAIHRPCMQNVTIVHVVTSEKRPPIDLSPGRWSVLRTALPMRVTGLMVAQSFEGPGKQDLIDFYAYQELRATEYKAKRPIELIAGNSVRQTLQLLEMKGLASDILPACLGGTYGFDKFHEFVRQRLSVEDILSAAPLARYRHSSVPEVTSITAVTKRGTLAKGVASKREQSALYSRRSMYKRKLEKIALENQRDVWRARNTALREQNSKLEEALWRAHQLIFGIYGLQTLPMIGRM